MTVIATVGHVSHGKSTLVHRLTGTHPDRLPDEKRLHRTIELGFAFMPAGDQTIGFVDVPGHHRLVGNMLGGIFDASMVMLVVAANEGWRAQTAEHLEIVDALGLKGVIAITKTDVSDPTRAVAEVAERVDGTSLVDAPIVPVSSVTGEGIDLLASKLAQLSTGQDVNGAEEPTRFWIDRSFSVQGTGTVVTGTLRASQSIATGATLENSRSGSRGRVRGLRVFGEPTVSAHGPARVAVNIAGSMESHPRGSALTLPGTYASNAVLDIYVADNGSLAFHRDVGVLLYFGTTRSEASLRELDRDLGFARVRIAQPLPMRIGDLAILRDPASAAVASARVVGVSPPRLQRRGRGRSLAAAYAAARLDADLLGELRARETPLMSATEFKSLGYGTTKIRETVGRIVAASTWNAWVDHVRGLEESGEIPAAPVVAQELGIAEPAIARELLAEAGIAGAAAENRPDLTDEDQRALRSITSDPYAYLGPARLAEIGATRQSITRLTRAGALARLPDDVILPATAADDALVLASRLKQPFAVSTLRTTLASTRRVCLALLTHWRKRGWIYSDEVGQHRLSLAGEKRVEQHRLGQQ